MGAAGGPPGAWEAPEPTGPLPGRLLFLKLEAHSERERFAFCSVRGCERIKIKALLPKDAGVSDCTASAYPRFAERPVVDVPMPRKLLGAQLVSGRGGPEPTRADAGTGGAGDAARLETDARARLCVPEDEGPLPGGEDGKFQAALLPSPERRRLH